MARMDASARGAPRADTVPSGFPSIDKTLGGGFRRRDLLVLSGDVGSGKSSLALAIALRAAMAGTPTLYLSGEMSEERLMERALAIQGKASVDELRSGKLSDAARAAVGAAAVRLRDLPLIIRSLKGAEFGEIAQALDVVPRRALLILDYLQLVAPPGSASTHDEGLALVARALKQAAMDQDVALLAVAQLPEHRARREDPRPTLDDLGGLGVLKQHADVVLSLYREEMYRTGGGMEGATELIVSKNRNGPTGFVDLYYYQRWMRFVDMLDPEP